MTTFQTVAHYYLGTNLKCQLTEDLNIDFDFEEYEPNEGSIWTLSGINQKGLLFENGEEVPFLLTVGYSWIGPDASQFKPMLRSLDKLTQPITVEGEVEAFVPMERIAKMEFPNFTSTIRLQGPMETDFHYSIVFNTDSLHALELCLGSYSKNGIKFIFDMDCRNGDKTMTMFSRFRIFQQLLAWGFNLFNIPAEEFIEINEQPRC